MNKLKVYLPIAIVALVAVAIVSRIPQARKVVFGA